MASPLGKKCIKSPVLIVNISPATIDLNALYSLLLLIPKLQLIALTINPRLIRCSINQSKAGEE